ncbi:MAG: methionyl-tRNA formyltransferase [Deltaproteobacteria bacterium]|nr:methionyl-tRNA formyltransferase [Deltaproteobacteria bacterium]MBN2846449.1 methionyl-tRNA formyltransferase [Deltaproteobacteria bacterium]
MKPTILFLGTPEFAVPSLDILVKNDYTILGVVTQPDKPKGRGKKLVPPPVKIFAENAGIPIYQPDRVRDETFLRVFREISPDMVVLAAFGQILPIEIIELPRMGCLNVHPSLLPLYRGAAPINWALINGEEKTGVTIMMMDEGVDTGDILLQEEMDIAPDEIFDNLHNRLSQLGAEILLKAVKGVAEGSIERKPQDSSRATYAPKLTKDTGYIDWNQSAHEIVNLIRGLSSTPGAYAFLRDKKLKIYHAVPGPLSTGEKEPGTIGQFMESGLQVSTADGHVYIQDVQLEGKKRLSIDSFLRGFRLSQDDVLE